MVSSISKKRERKKRREENIQEKKSFVMIKIQSTKRQFHAFLEFLLRIFFETNVFFAMKKCNFFNTESSIEDGIVVFAR